MALNKKSKTTDAIGNLYRAAFFLARDSQEKDLAMKLLRQANQKLNSKQLTYLIKSAPKIKRLILAEKILDEYQKMVKCGYGADSVVETAVS